MRTHNFKDFKKFIGHLTVSSSIIYCSTRHSSDYVKQNFGDNEYPWSEFAKSYNVRLDIKDIEKYNQRIYQLLLLNIYTALDQYIINYKINFKFFMKKEWHSEKGSSFVDEVRKNLDIDKINKNHCFDNFLCTLNYYRYIRNFIVHGSKKDKEDALKYRDKQIDELNILKESYKMKSAPSLPDEINFHDVKYFSRILLDFLPKIENLLYPGNEKIINFLPQERLDRYNKIKEKRNIDRARNFLIACLVEEFGLSYEISGDIADNFGLLA